MTSHRYQVGCITGERCSTGKALRVGAASICIPTHETYTWRRSTLCPVLKTMLKAVHMCVSRSSPLMTRQCCTHRVCSAQQCLCSKPCSHGAVAEVPQWPHASTSACHACSPYCWCARRCVTAGRPTGQVVQNEKQTCELQCAPLTSTTGLQPSSKTHVSTRTCCKPACSLRSGLLVHLGGSWCTWCTCTCPLEQVHDALGKAVA